MVSTLDATRSWHGTSIQCVQPMPESLQEVPTLIHNIRKHPQTSPISSPIAIAKSKRTLTEQHSPHSRITIPRVTRGGEDNDLATLNIVDNITPLTSPVTFQNFTTDLTEISSLDSFRIKFFQAMLLKHHEASRRVTVLPRLTSLLCALHCGTREREKSNVVYFYIRSEKADSKETLVKVLANLHNTFILSKQKNWLLVVGNAKTFDLLHAIKSEYGTHLKWVLPFPGDWYILFNYQKALMKLYCDAGLKQLGEQSGHRAETLTSLVQCTNFKRTHNFLLQVTQAFYQFFLTLYKAKPELQNCLAQINSALTSIIDSFASISEDSQVTDFSLSANEEFEKMSITCEDFHVFIIELCSQQDTVKFWYQFVFEDCLSNLALYTSVRLRDWNLRTGSIKQMAPLFEAFDRQIYQRLIPRHLMDLAQLPATLLHDLQDGGFSVRLSTTGVALDECHEMKINKDKMAVIRPSPDKMEHIYHSLQFKANCINNLKEQIFPERKRIKNSFKPTSKDRVAHANAQAMRQAIENHGMFHKETLNKGLWNFMHQQQATPEQTHDLLNHREIGHAGFKHYVNTKFLKQPSANTPKKRTK